MTDPTPTVPFGISTRQIAEAFVAETRRSDAVILRTTGEWTTVHVVRGGVGQ